MITSAPRARSRRAFSCDILSGIVKMQRYPFTAAAIASPTPVLPDVASTINPPGLRRPSRSAASIIAMPMRSFTEPPGLKNSALAYTGVRTPCVTRFSRISGVQPMVSRTLAYGLAWDGTGVRLLGRIPHRRGGGVAPRRRGRIDAPGCASHRRRRGGSLGPRRHRVRLVAQHGRLRLPELDRLQEPSGDRHAAALGGCVAQLFRAVQRGR